MMGSPLLILGLVCCLGRALTLPGPAVANTTASLEARAAPPLRTSICGYSTGDPSKGWLAPEGYDCRVDTSHGIWGFCPTTIIAAADCSLGGYCIDDSSCSSGCGSLTNNTRISTWTCTPSDPSSRYCSFAYLTVGVDQTYSYFHCGPDPGTAYYLAQPTAQASPTNTITPSSGSALPGQSFSSPASATSGSGASLATSDPTGASRSPADNTNAIIGGVIGGIALVCGCVIIVVYMKHVRSRKPPSSTPRRMGASRDVGFPSLRVKAGGWGPRELPAGEGRDS